MFHIAAIFDPLSETAQKWSSLLKVGDYFTFYQLY